MSLSWVDFTSEQYPLVRKVLAAVVLVLGIIMPAQAVIDLVDAPDQVIAVGEEAGSDAQIESRITTIFAQVDSLKNVAVDVSEGVATLRGDVPNEAAAEKAVSIVSRVEGVIAVEDSTLRTLDLVDNLVPMLQSIKEEILGWIRAAPLVLAALGVFLFFAIVAHQLARRSGIWAKLTPNPFLAQILAQAVRVAGILLGVLLALNLLGATALMGTILGSAGVVGLAISFGVKDAIENYISSIMLSIRQPFRANDHVVIGESEGIVVRLTSRSTIIMTLDGNHLRIPNATVYKSPILNYTRNPQRRFEFVLGVDAEDDPADAIGVGVAVLSDLDWVLEKPKPHAIIETVGDSNIVLKFMGWIDQRESDFGKSRSLSIRATKNALEEQGFSLPEPIYRLRFDNSAAISGQGVTKAPNQIRIESSDNAAPEGNAQSREKRRVTSTETTDSLDVEPENHVSEQAHIERSVSGEEDLLDSSRPIE